MSAGSPSEHRIVKSRASRVGEAGRSDKRRTFEPSSSISSPYGDSPTGYAGAGKVAIPRLPSDDLGDDTKSRDASKVDRTNHACEPCRSRKTKCSGDRPICKHCRQFNITCTYADGKRDRAKRHQEQLERKVALYEALLVEAGPNLGPTVWSRFQKVRSHDYEESDTHWHDSGASIADGEQEPEKGENVRAARQGSIDAIDLVGEDISKDSDTQAAGFVGKASGIDWQRNLNKKENDVISDHTGAATRQARQADISIASMSYQTSHAYISELDDANLQPHSVPSYQEASYLTKLFFENVYPSFPVLPKINFKTQLERAYSGNFENHAKPNDRWRAIMNLVFAAAARYCKMAGRGRPHINTRHETFFARAARLGLTGRAILGLTDLQQVQIFALSSFYLLAINNVGKSWLLAGAALHSAISLGLQVEIESDALSEHAKEARYRLWWAVYGLEITLMIVTGRPSGISVQGFSTPLPVPYNEETFDPSRTDGTGINWERFKQTSYRSGSVPNNGRIPKISSDPPSGLPATNTGFLSESLANVELSDALFFIFRSRLCLIVHETLDTIYQPAAAHHLWSQVQAGIHRYSTALDDWQSNLPTEFDFRIQQNNNWDCHRVHLAALFYSAKILVTRPCLCEMEGVQPTETVNSLEFNRDSAKVCVQSALAIIALLPRSVQISFWALEGPWWMIIHYIFSAVTILTVSLFYDCTHIGEDQKATVVQAIKHGISWLHALAQEPSQGADRAWRIAAMSFARICQRMEIDIHDALIPNEFVPAPPRADAASGRNRSEDHNHQYASAPSIPAYSAVLEGNSYPASSTVLNPTITPEVGIGSMFGQLFTANVEPTGYPVPIAGNMDFAADPDPFLSSPTMSSRIQPDMNPRQNVMPQNLDSYISARAAASVPVVQPFPNTVSNEQTRLGAGDWSPAQPADAMQRPELDHSQMDIDYDG